MDKQLQIEEFEKYMRTQDMVENTIRAYLFAIRQYFQIYPELTYSDLQLYKLHL
ncbi:integrase, partial [Klebsiella oxytoca]